MLQILVGRVFFTRTGTHFARKRFCTATSRFREENNSLHAIRALKETARAMPAPKCWHRYFCAVLDSFIRAPHHPDIA
ncbi:MULTISPECIES: hypothetical protein [Bradyrhizobium]|uniref:hypothetical protein n=1 Tax=Bradyrhizobium elkanii TaxID=29448 RepID=UPI002715477B|nr:hypothetical protein [Bradyrhizobium elkanii]WLA49975.1 hypothetical protein QIH80_07255 [Bradyrhizobium elkanii]WLB79799.1 hypothetical protein QIH83_36755 [Bradyrhizobium elkanii]